ncbi:putative DNA-binding transcriptional regulator [mine drainage metagenome]|uniref:Putative DNA-binding transcriptional regulator n=1 Tax=mine drainage metagenome TaxID=410659 RepID=A0A1J5QSQ2_9ZZZZ
MSYQQVDLVEIRAWGDLVGAVALDPATGFYAFEYDEDWIARGKSLAPLQMSNRSGVFEFPQLAPETYYRLPAMLADALPDKFGNALVDAYLADQGVPTGSITPLDRLAYAADRGMGALTFHPPIRDGVETSTAVQLADLVSAARSLVSGEITDAPAVHEALRQLIQVGTSAGGARAKAVIAYNPATGQVRSGQFDAPEGFEHWIVKLDGVSVDPNREFDPLTGGTDYGRVEYAYYLMATRAGIEMSECALLPEGPRTHFLTRRFDRTSKGERIHLQSLCAMAHLDFNLISTHSYSQYFATINELGLGSGALSQAFRRMVFNVVAVNRDDHTKNLAFLLPENGAWQLAPAYDVTHSHNSRSNWTARHQMSVNGKFDGITLADLREVGDRHLVPNYAGLINEVFEAVGSWPDFAKGAGVSAETRERIAKDMDENRPR